MGRLSKWKTLGYQNRDEWLKTGAPEGNATAKAASRRTYKHVWTFDKNGHYVLKNKPQSIADHVKDLPFKVEVENAVANPKSVTEKIAEVRTRLLDSITKQDYEKWYEEQVVEIDRLRQENKTLWKIINKLVD